MPEPYKNSTRFKARGYFGQIATAALCVNIVARDYDSAKKRKRAKSARATIIDLIQLGEDDRARIVLDYDVVYPAERNDKANWIATEGGEHFVAVSPLAFRGAVGGLSHPNGAPMAQGLFASSTAILGQNKAHTIRFQIAKPDSGQAYSYWYYSWGDWVFEIQNGQASVYRLTKEWTAPLESELNEILASVDADGARDISPAQQVRAQEIEALIYADEQSISKIGSSDWYEGAHEITFLPDEHGVFNVLIEGAYDKDSTEVTHSEIIATRKTGVLWPAGAVTIGSNGGAYAWQIGRPDYRKSGSFFLGGFEGLEGVNPEGLQVTIRGDANGGTLDHEITEAENEGDLREIVIAFAASGDGTRSPVFYSAQVFKQAGARNGSDTVLMDTEDFKPKNIIANVSPTWEKDGRRSSVTLELLNPNGGILANVSGEGGSNVYPGIEIGTSHPFLHDRLADVVVNGFTLIRKGIIQTSTVNNITTPDMTAFGWAKGGTRNLLTIGDFWALADEFLLRQQPIGDGLRLGDYLRLLLQLRGHTIAEISEIDANDGRVLPVAVFGESPCVQPSYECVLGEFLRKTMEKYGLGWVLSCNRGVWSLDRRSTEIKAVFETFEGGATSAARVATPPIYRLFETVDMPRDFGDCWNHFTVTGGPDSDGTPITRTWTYHESISDSRHPSFIGRVKRYPTVTDEGLRTENEVYLAVRSVAAANSKPGRFCESSAQWVNDVFPGDRVTVSGIEFEIERIPSGSTMDDVMSFGWREVIAMAGG